ncbi:MAG: ABC transporter ATP-binding protein [Candidatus Izemoplasmatales bacterium]
MDSIRVESLYKTYNTFQLKDVSFVIPQGYIMGFIGENGAGKTTTIKSMLNIINKDSGKVIVFDKDIDDEEVEIKKQLGYISGDSFYPKKKLKEVTAIYKTFFDTWDEEIYQSFLLKFKLDDQKRIDQLSKGMKMKYELSLAMSHHAKLLILDEPTSGLDPVVRDELLEIFQTIVEEGDASVLFSTHITSDLEKCADYITFIQNGQIIESTTKDEFIDKYMLINGELDQIDDLKDLLIGYKRNAFGFNGLIETDKLSSSLQVKSAKPSLDDIMIYFAEKERNDA